MWVAVIKEGRVDLGGGVVGNKALRMGLGDAYEEEVTGRFPVGDLGERDRKMEGVRISGDESVECEKEVLTGDDGIQTCRVVRSPATSA